jgi:hypothetical protein
MGRIKRAVLWLIVNSSVVEDKKISFPLSVGGDILNHINRTEYVLRTMPRTLISVSSLMS